MKITVSTPTAASPRATMLRGLFDIPDGAGETLTWETTFEKELLTRPWSIGLISGPSGSGKSTVADHIWPAALTNNLNYTFDKALIDEFPPEMPLREVTELLSSVGFSSPPAWLRPYSVLSTGQRFRADIARLLAMADGSRPILVDEYTSVVDRTVAQIGSAAIAKIIRRRNQQFIAVSCHDDVIEWLQPDWIYLPAENLFSWRSLRRRPNIDLKIFRCASSAWPLFAPHHYLTESINPAAWCWIATINQRPVAFSAWLTYFGRGEPARREHRTVCLPDFQGVGIGNALSDTIASMWAGLGKRAKSTTTHPGMIASRQRSANWMMMRAPALGNMKDLVKHASTRLTAGFEYCGPPMQKLIAEALLK